MIHTTAQLQQVPSRVKFVISVRDQLKITAMNFKAICSKKRVETIASGYWLKPTMRKPESLNVEIIIQERLPSVVLICHIGDQEYYEKNILHPNYRKPCHDSTELERKNVF